MGFSNNLHRVTERLKVEYVCIYIQGAALQQGRQGAALPPIATVRKSDVLYVTVSVVIGPVIIIATR